MNIVNNIEFLFFPQDQLRAERDHKKNDTYCVKNLNLICTDVYGPNQQNLVISEGLYGIHLREFNKCIIESDNQSVLEHKTCFNFHERQKSFVLLGFCEETPPSIAESYCNNKRRLLWRIYIPFDGKYYNCNTMHRMSYITTSSVYNVRAKEVIIFIACC